ncbi:MAG: acyltransferase [Actinobacteria bacterium]|nr:acyltransferase [Actinomycetota bacterium]
MPTPTAVDQRLPALDGCRALAALAVLVNHVGVLSGFNGRSLDLGPYLARADVGVSVFFVLSGFLLYRPFVTRHLAGDPHQDVSSYARRRLLRIFPAYWVALVIVAFVLRAPPFEQPHSFVAHALLLQVYDGDQVVGGPIQQSWTLATELAFYAFLPCYAWLLARGRRNGARQLRFEVAGVAALWIGSNLLKVAALASGMGAVRFGQVNTWLPFRLDEFALGMGLAVAVAHWDRVGRVRPAWLRTGWTTLASWSVASLLFWITATRLGLPPSPVLSAREATAMRGMYSLVAILVVLPAVLAAGRGQLARTVLANRVAIWLGLISYGIYLWHEAFQDLFLRWTGDEPLRAPFLGMLVWTLVLSIVAGAASWYLVERPAMGWGRRTVRREQRADGPGPGSGSDESTAAVEAPG